MAGFFFVLSVLHIYVCIVWGDLISTYYFPYLSHELWVFTVRSLCLIYFTTFFFLGGVRLCRWLDNFCSPVLSSFFFLCVLVVELLLDFA